MQYLRHLVVPAFLLIALYTFIATSFLAAAEIPPRATASIIISEVAWGGTAASSNDEWIELYNASCDTIDLTGWQIISSDNLPTIDLSGTVAAHEFLLLERSDDNTVSDISAEFVYSGGLSNNNEGLQLRDASNSLIDSANHDGGSWPAGSGAPDYASMERVAATAADSASGWASNNGSQHNGLDANGNALKATPRQPNTNWQTIGCDSAELLITASAPASVAVNATFVYEFTVTNYGALSADNVQAVVQLPNGLSSTDGEVITFDLATLITGGTVTETVIVSNTAQLALQAQTIVTVTTTTTETVTSDNVATAHTLIGTPILINAVNFDAYTDGDEAVQLINISNSSADIGGWRVSDNPIGNNGVILPANTQLGAGATLWLAKGTVAFHRHFGFAADLTPPSLMGSWPLLNDSGDNIFLFTDADALQDTLVYENGDTTALGWDGVAVFAFRPNTGFAKEGQILYRKRDALTQQSVPDTNTASDWSQDPHDPFAGSKVRYAGWSLNQFFDTVHITETATLTIGITPDNGFKTVKQLIDSAETSLKISTFTLTNYDITQALIAAAQRGVSIDVLQEGAPPGGLLDQQRYLCAQLEAAGGRCWFMINENDSSLPTNQRVWDRYKFFHAKYILVDGLRVMVSSDNLSPNSMPSDTASGTTSGRRGVQIITDAPSVVAHIQTIWADDFAPAADYTADCRGATAGDYHCDIFRWTAHDAVFGTRYGNPPSSFIPETESGGITYTVRYSESTTVQGTFSFELIQAPENNLNPTMGLFALLAQAGVGDVVYVEQLDERAHWGSANATPATAPNPRLEAYISAARQGADVWILLDSYFNEQNYSTDDPSSNGTACAYIKQIATAEGLRLHCTTGNPTDRGIHNKMVLARIAGRGYVHIGSINGSEQSQKGNRELAIQVQSDEAFTLLADMFQRDYPHRIFLPVIMHNVRGPATYPLISEIVYNTPGPGDEAEFIEIVNPTYQAIDIGGWSIGDAVHGDDFEDNRIFPDGTMLGAREVIVIAFNGNLFSAEFNYTPDFEILNSDPNIPDLIDDPAYDPAAQLRLGNTGDEVILRDRNRTVIDAISYGNGSFPNVVPIPLASSTNRALERYPFNKDSDNGVNDFRENAPSPGQVP